MYNPTRPTQTSIQINKSIEGESIEKKVRRILNNKEPIKDGAPIIYTERKDGVHPETDPRTDRFELAIEARELRLQNHLALREARQKALEGQKSGETAPTAADNANS